MTNDRHAGFRHTHPRSANNTQQPQNRNKAQSWIGYNSEPNHALIRTIVTAQDWGFLIKSGQSISDIMKVRNIPEGLIWKRIQLAFLSPRLIGAILVGTTGHDLTIKTLTKIDVPLLWAKQEAQFIQ